MKSEFKFLPIIKKLDNTKFPRNIKSIQKILKRMKFIKVVI